MGTNKKADKKPSNPKINPKEKELQQPKFENQNNELLLAKYAVQKANEKYIELYDFAPTAYFTLSKAGKILELNLRAAQMLGKERSKLINSSLGFFVSVDTKPSFNNFFEKVFAGHTNEICEVTFSANGNKPLYVYLKGNVAENEEQCFITAIDISEHKQDELKLAESEERYRVFFENNDAVILLVNPENGKVVFANQAAASFYGYSREQLAKMNVNEINTLSAQEIQQKMAEAIKRKQNYFVFKHKLANGNIRDVEVYQTKLNINNQLLFSIIVHDITDRKVAEEALKVSEEKYRVIAQTAIDAIISINSDGIILSWNSAAEKIFGYSSAEMLNKELLKIIPSIHNLVHRAGLKRLKEGGKESLIGKMLELKALKKDGTEISIELSLSLWKKDSEKYYTGIIRDISHRKRIEKRLVNSEERLSQIMENSQEWIWEINNKGLYTFSSQSMENMLGFKNEEIVGKKYFYDFFVPNYPKQLKKVAFDVFKSKEPFKDFVNQNVTKSGEIIWLSTSGVPIIDEDGKLLGYRGADVDITERIKAEQAIIESQERFDLAMKATKDGIFDRDLLNNEIYYSPGWKNMLGYTDDELPNISSTWESLTAPEDVKRSKKMMHDLVNKKIDRYELEFKMLHKNGHWVDILSRADAVLNEKGKAIRIVGTHIDITERKKAEQVQKVIYNISTAVGTSKSLESFIGLMQKELGTIIDTTNFYIALYDPKKDSLSLPFFVDEKDNFTSIPAGKTLTYYVIKTQKPLLATKEKYKELVDLGEVENYGSIQKIWLGVPLKVEGEVTGVLAVQSYTDENAFDQTDQKMLEFIADQISILINRKNNEVNLKEALKRATESDRLKSTFLATMSHELRTPLNAIIGFSEFLNQKSPPEDVEKFGKIINSSGYHLLSIVNDLFDITLIESGETKTRMEEVPLKNMFNDVHSIIVDKQLRSGKSNIELRLEIPPDEIDLIIITDLNKLRQILTNLLKNALKFTVEGHIKYGYKLGKEQNNTVLQFYVKDTGIGVKKDKQEIIFNIFTQGEDTNTRRFGGTGIGLSVAKKLTELLGGRIWLESEENKGSTFFFSLPFNKPQIEVTKDSGNIESKIKYNKKLILIAEDDESSYTYIKFVVKKLGLNCIWAKNGKEAVSMCKENQNINLVLMDINMPVLDGFKATLEIKKFNSNLPIIAQTAYAIAGDREKILEAGCDDYISKPINRKALVNVIEKHLR